jgi:hypothetical protein
MGAALGLPQQAKACFWGVQAELAAAQPYCDDMNWYIGQIQESLPRDPPKSPSTPFTLSVTDVTRRRALKPTGSAAADRFAPGWIISNPDQAKALPLGKYDINEVEVRQIRREFKAKRFSSVMIPGTRRVPVDLGRNGLALKKAADAYRLKSGEYQPEYSNTWSDLSGNEYLGFGVTVGGKLRFLIVRIRKS